jgi:hypothetical protein
MYFILSPPVALQKNGFDYWINGIVEWWKPRAEGLMG